MSCYVNYTVDYIYDDLDDVEDAEMFYTAIETNLNKTLKNSPIDGYAVDGPATSNANSDWEQQGTMPCDLCVKRC